ncbi:hypothetical protein RCL1_000066 [Eukaryota sp. TZLM3-RCL]
MSEPPNKRNNASVDPKPLVHVVFAISGLQNPKRADLRHKACNLGATYCPDLTQEVTHLVCVSSNTPRYKQARDLNTSFIVYPDWVEECVRQNRKVNEYTFVCVSDDEGDSSSDDSDPNSDSDLGKSGDSDDDKYESDFVVE